MWFLGLTCLFRLFFSEPCRLLQQSFSENLKHTFPFAQECKYQHLRLDQFIQCYESGNVFHIYESHFESEIKDSLETVSNPFEGNESVFLSTDSRATQRKKGKKRKSRFSYKQRHDDPEIETETKIYNRYITSYIRYLNG